MRPELLVCAPLRVEHAALRGSGLRIVRTGYGPRRSARSAGGLAAADFGALAVAGLGGGLDPTLRAGDVVVGTEVFAGERTHSLCAPELLARELRRAGLSVRLGSVVTTDHPVTGDERLALARTGALVVDMESGVLTPVAGRRARAVVRVVLDTPRQPLIGPGTPWRLVGALRRLRETGDPLLRWFRTVAGAGSQDTVRSRWSKEVP
ncbi:MULTISPECIES: hypothetical protein [unclassified Actinopolyspora]|uniref:phosphorylase family protein n=1 Tax=unclassified Actinopolyspora TaxID=2639451 RepID=UPI0013F5EFEE|nr:MULTISPECIES: hypothetical protein [unclassified Actinopolyspora]NHD15518.1 hypothetical protein [Actinopolyspora sp. BKK2]NHE75268.1 hypothetical protein [Actinopolyspora sp. BKK1]